MNARQRGACWLLLALLVGRFLDTLDLPFERVDRSERLTPVAFPEDPASNGDEPGVQAGTSPTPAVPAAAAPETAESAPTAENPLSINEATAEELQALPGVGPVLAQRIVAFRDEHGDFRDATTLRQVKGIGERLASRLAPLLRFH